MNRLMSLVVLAGILTSFMTDNSLAINPAFELKPDQLRVVQSVEESQKQVRKQAARNHSKRRASRKVISSKRRVGGASSQSLYLSSHEQVTSRNLDQRRLSESRR